MNIINIFPNNLINSNMIRQKYELYLAHQILKEPKKFEFLKEDNGFSYKILDNSAYELGSSISLDDLLKAASVIKADEIVLPDIFKNNKSYNETKKALDFLKDTNYKLAAVAQGKDICYLQTYLDKLLEEERIDVIMLPKWSGKYRDKLTTFIKDKSNKKIHWLGMSTDLEDFITEPIRTLDTGYFVALAQKNINRSIFDPRDPDIKIDLDYMDIDLEKLKNIIEQQERILKNV